MSLFSVLANVSCASAKASTSLEWRQQKLAVICELGAAVECGLEKVWRWESIC